MTFKETTLRIVILDREVYCDVEIENEDTGERETRTFISPFEEQMLKWIKNKVKGELR